MKLSIDELADMLQRKRLSSSALSRIEAGEKFIPEGDRARLEQALQLPIGGLSEAQFNLYDQGVSPAEALATILAVSSKSMTHAQGLESVPICYRCGARVRTHLRRYGLSRNCLLVDEDCVCEGGGVSDTRISLELALVIGRLRKLLLLGGSVAVAEVCRSVRRTEIYTVSAGGTGFVFDTQSMSDLDAIMELGGQVGHAQTQPIRSAYLKLAPENQPAWCRPASSNLSGLVDAIFDLANRRGLVPEWSGG